MPKRTEEKEKFLQKLALAVVPLVRPVVPLRRSYRCTGGSTAAHESARF